MASSDPDVLPKVERSRNIAIVRFTSGAIRDVESVIARELNEIMIGAGKQLILLDFTNVEQLNGIELGTLITLHEQVEQTGGRLILFNLSAQLFEVLKITKLDTLLRIRRARLVDVSGGTTGLIGRHSSGTIRPRSSKAGNGSKGAPSRSGESDCHPAVSS